jgi:hypothetical protein
MLTESELHILMVLILHRACRAERMTTKILLYDRFVTLLAVATDGERRLHDDEDKIALELCRLGIPCYRDHKGVYTVARDWLLDHGFQINPVTGEVAHPRFH